MQLTNTEKSSTASLLLNMFLMQDCLKVTKNVNNLLALKQATGTLSPQDLQAINAWLITSPPKRKLCS